ncbi:MAG: chemotaxis protein CheA [Chromatiaceae bacterium]|nr:chemotaxis protein CheA [Chromatiaceae bacterium]
MSALLQQFLAEGRDFLQSIGDKLLALEERPEDAELIGELFRLVHTLKGNSGLFELPDMTRTLHAAEDLMDAVRDGRASYARAIADRLLEAMDFVGRLIERIEHEGLESIEPDPQAAPLAQALRALIPAAPLAHQDAPPDSPQDAAPDAAPSERLSQIPEAERMTLYRRLATGERLHWLRYCPEPECFYKGEDPFFQAMQIPGVCWRQVREREPWPPLAELDAYRCVLVFELISTAECETLQDHFRYVPEQIELAPLAASELMWAEGESGDPDPALIDFVRLARERLAAGDWATLARATQALLELCSPSLRQASLLRWLHLVLECAPAHSPPIDPIDTLIEQLATEAGMSATAKALQTPAPATPGRTAHQAIHSELLHELWEAQRAVLLLDDDSSPWFAGRLRASAASLSALLDALGRAEARPALEAALAAALAQGSAAPLRDWLTAQPPPPAPEDRAPASAAPAARAPAERPGAAPGRADEGASPSALPRTLKIDQGRIDGLMDLIGEMVVAKNALPYLAARAERDYGSRELAREIKAQYAVINRIAEDLQDAIMQVRMMPVSFVFQRFPRLVRDLAHKLGKEVRLSMEGEDTEADKNVIEALADPLIHILRNSLDHGLETPEERRAAGKPATGQLSIRARQESDRAIIEISDDGRGIDPARIRRKAYERGIIDETQLERLSDQEAINLVFAPGFSTAEQVSDLSGRGVGMDVVRSAIAAVKGGIELRSELGRGTRLLLTLPLSMAVTNVMMVRAQGQDYGIPMDSVVETVRVPRSAIRTLKQRQATVLRGRLVPLLALNALLGSPKPPQLDEAEAHAVLVVRVRGEPLGLLIDDFRETVDIILKPLGGVLETLRGYAGTALLGDGSVLLVLDPEDLVQCSN